MASTGVQAGHRTKCWGCGLPINVGEPFVRLKLRKAFRVPCVTCRVPPKSTKRFHAACRPIDPNKAMGYNPNHQNPSSPSYSSSGGAVPPPPKPDAPEEVALRALIAIQDAIKARSRNNPTYVKTIEAEFKTFQGLTARALRPGTPEEGLTAMKFALTRALKLVF